MDQNTQKPINPTVPPDPQVAPVPEQKIQYVITQQSLNGIGGWLLFFLIAFAVIGLGEIGRFFQILNVGVKNPADTMAVVFAPLLALSFLASVVFISMRKKLAITIIYISLAIFALYSVMNQLVSNQKDGLALMASGIVVSVVLYLLLALYFRQSRRVKETLVK